MKKFSRCFLILWVVSSLAFLSGCPYKLKTLSPKYWDESMRETTEDIDDVFGARSYN